MPLPSGFRFGGSHQFKIKDKSSDERPYISEFFTHIEMEKIVNSGASTVYKFGEEITIMELFSVRTGMLFSRFHDEYFYEYNSKYKVDYTFGAGINVPLNKVFKIKNKWDLKIDYAANDFKNFLNFEYDYGTFYTWEFAMNFVP
jgi:hypothetical protein